MKSYSLNLLSNVGKEYENIFYFKNITILEKLDFNNNNNLKNKYAICDKISFKFGKKTFECITFIPNEWNIKHDNI